MDNILYERGRKPNESTIACRKAVLGFMENHEKFTVIDISEETDIDDKEVRKALRFFETRGIVERDGKKQTALSGGRPATLWKTTKQES